jgi:hypothetical protein
VANENRLLIPSTPLTITTQLLRMDPEIGWRSPCLFWQIKGRRTQNARAHQPNPIRSRLRAGGDASWKGGSAIPNLPMPDLLGYLHRRTRCYSPWIVWTSLPHWMHVSLLRNLDCEWFNSIKMSTHWLCTWSWRLWCKRDFDGGAVPEVLSYGSQPSDWIDKRH